jgi:hypothetical protein
MKRLGVLVFALATSAFAADPDESRGRGVADAVNGAKTMHEPITAPVRGVVDRFVRTPLIA